MATGQLRLKDSTGRLSNALGLEITFGETPAPAGKPMMGGTTSSNSTWTPFDQAFGPVGCRRTYGSTIPASFEASQAGTANDVEAGRASYWSFKPNMTTYATDTSQHAALRTFLRSVPVGHPFTLICYHEPEDNIAAGSFTLAQWKACVQKTGEIVQEINAEKGPNSRLRNGICIMGPWTFDSRSAYDTYDWTFTPAQLAVIDVVGIDPYKWNPGDGSLEQILTRDDSGSLTSTTRTTMGKLSAWGKPIALMEWACTSTGFSDAGKAAWIRAAWTWMKAWNASHPVKIEAAIYFHTNQFVSSEPRSTWEVLGSGLEQSRQALADIIADART